ncbi:MAG: SOS response-associated peptidase [Pseudomonadota bacterium]
MCGRYQLTLPLEAMQALFEIENQAEPYPPRYNVAPTQPIHLVRAAPGGRALTLMRWGFLPSWLKDPQKFPLLINARSETVVDKPAFRNAVRRRRALIPATGFYEWRKEGAVKQPYFFEPEGPIAFAGIWETWCGPDGEEMDTAAILTTSAEGVPADYHDRMPLTVPRHRFADWLDPANENGAAALAFTEKAAYTARPVSRRLSNARNEGAALMEPDPTSPAPPPAEEEEAPRLL